MSSVIVGQYRACTVKLGHFLNPTIEGWDIRTKVVPTPIWLKENTELFKKFDKENEKIYAERFKK